MRSFLYRASAKRFAMSFIYFLPFLANSQSIFKIRYIIKPSHLAPSNTHDPGMRIYQATGVGTFDSSSRVELTSPLKATITLFQNGNQNVIGVDFWRIVGGPSELDRNTVQTASTPITVTKLNKSTSNTYGFILSDNRSTLGNPTFVFEAPFYCWSLGINTIPLKYRPQLNIDNTTIPAGVTPPQVDLTLTFGYTIGRAYVSTRRISQYSATFGLFSGLSAEQISPLKENSPLASSPVRTYPAFTRGIYATVAVNTIGIIFSVGTENAIGDHATDWVYNNKLWYGVGLSVNASIFQ